MTKLSEELQKLKSLKLKADFLRLLKSSIGDIHDDKFKTIEKETKDQVFAFFDAQIDMIESGEYKHEKELDTLFTKDEVLFLKTLISRSMKKGIDTIEKKVVISKKPVNNEGNGMAKPDKIKFALANRKLGGKEVKVKSMDNATGTVVGLDAPHVVIKLLTGQTVSVLLEDVLI